MTGLRDYENDIDDDEVLEDQDDFYDEDNPEDEDFDEDDEDFDEDDDPDPRPHARWGRFVPCEPEDDDSDW